MDWETLSCPHHHCRGYGKPFAQGYLVKNGTSRGQQRAWCKACEASVVLSYGTAYYGLEADPAIFETAVRALNGVHHSSGGTLPKGLTHEVIFGVSGDQKLR